MRRSKGDSITKLHRRELAVRELFHISNPLAWKGL